jgi:hypothetical protein
MTDFRFAENDSRNESTQGERESDGVSSITHANGGGDDSDEEQLTGFPGQHLFQ